MKKKSVNLKILYDVAADRRRVDSLTGTGALTRMIESIEKDGLLYPLTIMLPHGERSKGKWYRVVDGSLRLAALKQMALQGKVKPDMFVCCFEIDTMDEKKQRVFRANKSMSHEEYGKLMDHQKKYIHEAIARGLFKYDLRDLDTEGKADVGKLFYVSTPTVEQGNLKAYYDHLNQQSDYRRKIAEEFARHGQRVVFDESITLPPYAAADVGYSKYLSDTWKRQAEDRVHRPGPTKMVYVDFENQTSETFHNQRPVIVDIDMSNITDEMVMARLKAKKAIADCWMAADFASFELRMAYNAYSEGVYTNGVLTGEVRSRAYDLGDNW